MRPTAHTLKKYMSQLETQQKFLQSQVVEGVHQNPPETSEREISSTLLTSTHNKRVNTTSFPEDNSNDSNDIVSVKDMTIRSLNNLLDLENTLAAKKKRNEILADVLKEMKSAFHTVLDLCNHQVEKTDRRKIKKKNKSKRRVGAAAAAAAKTVPSGSRPPPGAMHHNMYTAGRDT